MHSATESWTNEKGKTLQMWPEQGSLNMHNMDCIWRDTLHLSWSLQVPWLQLTSWATGTGCTESDLKMRTWKFAFQSVCNPNRGRSRHNRGSSNTTGAGWSQSFRMTNSLLLLVLPPPAKTSSIKVRVAIEPFKTRAGFSFAPLISKLASRSFLHHLLPLILVRGKFGRNNKDFTNYIFETKK